jgi:hypothetical protein
VSSLKFNRWLDERNCQSSSFRFNLQRWMRRRMVSMNRKLRRSGLLLIFVTSLCFAGSRCADAGMRQASIGGNTIRGSVILSKKPVQFTPVRIYFSSGKAAWSGATDANGNFASNELPPGGYRLDIEHWGSTEIQLRPNLHTGTSNKTPLWNLFLSDHSCVMTAMIW